MNVAAKIWSYCLKILYKHTVLTLAFLFTLGVFISLWTISNLSLNLIESQALHNAELSVKALKYSHNLYAENIERIKQIPDLKVTRNYQNQKNTIPPPFTNTIELGKRLSDRQIGHWIGIYSKYPYPSRQETGGIKDRFEREAWNFLVNHPHQAFYRREKVNNITRFRYGEAIVMKPSCIGCHNTLPDSPKKDWQVGDVRGVIETSLPLNQFISQKKVALRETFFMLGGVSCLGVAGLALVIGRLRHTAEELEMKVRVRTQELELMAISDGLTKIANRRHFNDYLSQMWQQMSLQKQPLSLILCDIDYFKQYNDLYGHIAGDDCLIEVATTINQVVAATNDFLARYGGEEFAVILPNTSLDRAKEIAKSMGQAVFNINIPHETSSISDRVTISLGISSVIPNQSKSSDILINTADQALYKAKKIGRNCSISQPVVIK